MAANRIWCDDDARFNREVMDDDITAPEVAERWGVSSNTVNRRRKQNGVRACRRTSMRYTDALITAYLYDGLTQAQISRELAKQDGIELTPSGVGYRVARLDMELQRKARRNYAAWAKRDGRERSKAYWNRKKIECRARAALSCNILSRGL